MSPEGQMCDENICISGDDAMPNIRFARILKDPVAVLYPRAAAYLDIAIMQAFYCDKLVLI
jgi:hypothetical protein